MKHELNERLSATHKGLLRFHPNSVSVVIFIIDLHRIRLVMTWKHYDSVKNCCARSPTYVFYAALPAMCKLLNIVNSSFSILNRHSIRACARAVIGIRQRPERAPAAITARRAYSSWPGLDGRLTCGWDARRCGFARHKVPQCEPTRGKAVWQNRRWMTGPCCPAGDSPEWRSGGRERLAGAHRPPSRLSPQRRRCRFGRGRGSARGCRACPRRC